MKKIVLTVILSVVLFVLSTSIISAYTVNDVSKHNTASDCWVVFDNGVYNITKYVSQHDEYLNIRSWCGTDITSEFKTKNGEGVDHKKSSYALFAEYKIGDISKTTAQITEAKPTTTNLDTTVEESAQEIATSAPKEYNLMIPLLISIILYWGTYIFVKNNKFGKINIVKFNGFWNTILFLTLLVPSFGFGIYMLIRIANPSIAKGSFDFLYWHVELSIVMGVLGISHLIQRLGIYLRQLNLKK